MIPLCSAKTCTAILHGLEIDLGFGKLVLEVWRDIVKMPWSLVLPGCA